MKTAGGGQQGRRFGAARLARIVEELQGRLAPVRASEPDGRAMQAGCIIPRSR